MENQKMLFVERCKSKDKDKYYNTLKIYLGYGEPITLTFDDDIILKVSDLKNSELQTLEVGKKYVIKMS